MELPEVVHPVDVNELLALHPSAAPETKVYSHSGSSPMLVFGEGFVKRSTEVSRTCSFRTNAPPSSSDSASVIPHAGRMRRAIRTADRGRIRRIENSVNRKVRTRNSTLRYRVPSRHLVQDGSAFTPTHRAECPMGNE
jgi:hypothetical protein